MAGTAKLSNEQAFQNLQYIQNHKELQKKEVYGFGVRGNRFVLVQQKDSLLSKIWYSFLKLLRFIKTDEKAVKALKDHTFTTIKSDEWRSWSEENGKVTVACTKQLIKSFKEQKERIAELEKNSNRAASDCDGYGSSLVVAINEAVSEKDKLIEKLEADVAQLRSDVAVAQNHYDRACEECNDKDSAIDRLEAKIRAFGETMIDPQKLEELEAQVKSLKHSKKKHKKEATKLKEEKSLLDRAWQHLHADITDVKQFLIEHGLLEEEKKAAASHHHKKHSKKKHTEKAEEAVA